MFGGKKEDVKSDKYQEMKSFTEVNDDMPDGAFFAMAQEMHGWEPEDWGWYSEVYEFDDKKFNKKK